MSEILDITEFKEEGEKLKKAIEQAVKDTQRVIYQPYPHILKMNTKQYRDLSPTFISQFDNATDQEFFLYKTKRNVMELEVI